MVNCFGPTSCSQLVPAMYTEMKLKLIFHSSVLQKICMQHIMPSVDDSCLENPRPNALRRKKHNNEKIMQSTKHQSSSVLRLRKSMADALHSAYPYHSSIFYLIKIQTHCRSLGMCKRCGDLRIVACSQCKGIGSVRKGGMLNLGMLDDLYESLGAEAKTDNLIPCTKCRSKGRLLCPECSKIA